MKPLALARAVCRPQGLLALVLAGTLAGCAPYPDQRSPAYGVDEHQRIARPWRPGLPELGVQIYWEDNAAEPPAIVHKKAVRALDYVVGLEANAVSLSFPFFVPGPDASTVSSGPGTPSPGRLAPLIDLAARRGLRVTIRPLLNERNLVRTGDWRGSLRPADPTAWFRSYRRFLEPYLAMARTRPVTTVVVGTELSSLERLPAWAEVTSEARRISGRQIAYSANWDSTARPSGADPVGLDAYPRQRVGTPDGVRAGWNTWLDSLARGPDLILYEVGIAAEDGAYRRPHIPHTPGAPVRPEVQRAWFAAACAAARQHRLGGLYWWRVDFHADPAHADPAADRHDSFTGRPAEQAIRDCFGTWSGIS
jgi:hypothetical protein